MSRAVDGTDYAVTRLHARYAQLLSADEWSRLSRIEHFAGFVQQASDTALRTWVEHFDPRIAPHRIETMLRDGFRQHVAEVAAWLPRRERAAVAWINALTALPELRHRAADGIDYDWLPPAATETALGAESDGAGLVQKWLRRWRALWPRNLCRDERRGLSRIADVWAQAARELHTIGCGTDGSLQLPLEIEMRRQFRRRRGSLIGAHCYLGLLWLQVSRLRGALLRRRVFAAQGGPTE